MNVNINTAISLTCLFFFCTLTLHINAQCTINVSPTGAAGIGCPTLGCKYIGEAITKGLKANCSTHSVSISVAPATYSSVFDQAIIEGNKEMVNNIKLTAKGAKGAVVWSGPLGGAESFLLSLSSFPLSFHVDGFLVANGHSTTSGGCFKIVDSNQTSIDNVVFSNCKSETTGGAIYAQTSTLKITNSKFMMCNASNGGAAHIIGYNNNFDNVTFEGNNASATAGALLLDDAHFTTISRSSFSYNFAMLDAGAIQLNNASSTSLMEVTLQANSALNKAGAMGCAHSSATTVTNSTFIDNHVSNPHAITIEDGKESNTLPNKCKFEDGCYNITSPYADVYQTNCQSSFWDNCGCIAYEDQFNCTTGATQALHHNYLAPAERVCVCLGQSCEATMSSSSSSSTEELSQKAYIYMSIGATALALVLLVLFLFCLAGVVVFSKHMK